jgi:hypothetical protein
LLSRSAIFSSTVPTFCSGFALPCGPASAASSPPRDLEIATAADASAMIAAAISRIVASEG